MFTIKEIQDQMRRSYRLADAMERRYLGKEADEYPRYEDIYEKQIQALPNILLAGALFFGFIAAIPFIIFAAYWSFILFDKATDSAAYWLGYFLSYVGVI